ncbi:class I SAM-dependent methyltransferase [Methylobacterium nigriterrae]|uniref:class I SAM-dependent methyltransferase n=1 Tax=Methylobacterium nigriterrae TaxID=3127512 RepID=UPI0030138E65
MRVFDTVQRAMLHAPSLGRGAKLLIPPNLRRPIYDFVFQRQIATSPDRVYLNEVIQRAVIRSGARRVLNIGVRKYTTTFTDALRAGGIEVWTLDIDPAVSRWGAPGRHIVADATRLDEVEACYGFDGIVASGVLGFGIDAEPQIRRAFEGLSRILEPGAFLVLGWNRNRVADPAWLWEEAGFAYDGRFHLGRRVSFSEVTHVYDFLAKAEPGAAAQAPEPGAAAG